MIEIERIEPSDVVAPLLREYLEWRLADVEHETGIRIATSDELAADLKRLCQFAPPSGAKIVSRRSAIGKDLQAQAEVEDCVGESPGGVLPSLLGDLSSKVDELRFCFRGEVGRVVQAFNPR